MSTTNEKQTLPAGARLFLLAGHDNTHDPGAVANGVQEAQLALEQRQLVHEALLACSPVVLLEPPELNLTDTINWVKERVTPQDVVLDLHFNAASPAARGSECFHRENGPPLEREIAAGLSAAVAETLATHDRGAKPESWSQHPRLGMLHTGAGTSLLMETCFLTNSAELETYLARKKPVAKAIADTLLHYFQQPGDSPAHPPA